MDLLRNRVKEFQNMLLGTSYLIKHHVCIYVYHLIGTLFVFPCHVFLNCIPYWGVILLEQCCAMVTSSDYTTSLFSKNLWPILTLLIVDDSLCGLAKYFKIILHMPLPSNYRFLEIAIKFDSSINNWIYNNWYFQKS